MGGPVEAWDFEAIEMAARRQAMRVAARAVEERINADEADHSGSSMPCACGKSARFAGRRSKTFESVLGTLILSRALITTVTRAKRAFARATTPSASPTHRSHRVS